MTITREPSDLTMRAHALSRPDPDEAARRTVTDAINHGDLDPRVRVADVTINAGRINLALEPARPLSFWHRLRYRPAPHLTIGAADLYDSASPDAPKILGLPQAAAERVIELASLIAIRAKDSYDFALDVARAHNALEDLTVRYSASHAHLNVAMTHLAAITDHDASSASRIRDLCAQARHHLNRASRETESALSYANPISAHDLWALNDLISHGITECDHVDSHAARCCPRPSPAARQNHDNTGRS